MMDSLDKDSQIKELTNKIDNLERQLKRELSSLSNRLYIEIDSIRIDILDLKEKTLIDNTSQHTMWCG